MGYVTKHSDTAFDIFATNLDGTHTLIHTYNESLSEPMAGYGLVQTLLIIEFTDKHPSGAKAAVSLRWDTIADIDFLHPYLPTPHSERVLVKETPQELQALFKDAKLWLPSIEQRPSRGAIARIFDRLVYSAQPLANFITNAPIPRV